MPRYSIPALLALMLCAAGAFLLTAVSTAPAEAQQPGTCPQTLPSGSAGMTCTCTGSDGSSTVWGTDYYTDDSNLCNAAVHAGAMPATGGTITIRTAPGRAGYTGTTRNGIATRDYGQWGRSIVFDGAGSFASVPLCPGSYNALGTTWSGTCRCEGVSNGSVWGSGPYTADSDLCRAARHAGAIGPAGGTVRVSPAPGQGSYAGTTRNGITTSRWGSYGNSFTVSR
jgi:hypothetical protein